MIRLARVARGIRTPLYGKADFFNPGGSVKDRVGMPMIESHERAGTLKRTGTLQRASALQRTRTLQQTGTLKGSGTLKRAATLLRAAALLLTFLLLLRFLLRELLSLARFRRSLRMRHANEGKRRRECETLRSKCNFNHETQPDRGSNHHSSHF